MKILFLCRGNVGRSQIAEALFNKVWGDRHEATSAGTELSGPEQTLGSLLPKTQYVVDVLKEEGIDVSESKRKLFKSEIAERIDKVICLFDTDNGLDDDSIKEFKDRCDKIWNVPDPKGTNLETHRQIKNQIKELVEKLSP